jgi:hypothetical protein
MIPIFWGADFGSTTQKPLYPAGFLNHLTMFDYRKVASSVSNIGWNARS